MEGKPPGPSGDKPEPKLVHDRVVTNAMGTHEQCMVAYCTTDPTLKQVHARGFVTAYSCDEHKELLGGGWIIPVHEQARKRDF